MNLAELRHLLGEGRAQLGAKVVREPLDLARAVAQLGTTRGIAAFQRYGYIERNGQANMAVPLGRFRVPEKITPQLACLDDLDAWLPRLRRDARDKLAPARLRLAEHRLSEALFAVAQHADVPSYWQSVLLGLVDVEALSIISKGMRSGPIPKLRPDWASAADDGTAEFRLAIAFALQWDEKPFGGIRRHWIPEKNDESAAVMKGRSGIDDAIALVTRRLIEASKCGQRRLALSPALKASSSSSDLTRFLAGEVDVDRTVALAQALMALDPRQWARNPSPPKTVRGTEYPDDAWLAIRLATLPWPLPDRRQIGFDPAIIRRLESGDSATAVDLAMRRLRAAGITATVRCAVVSPGASRLWASALAFPIERSLAEKFLRRLDPNIN
jgi:CRISPR-associated protein Csx17